MKAKITLLTRIDRRFVAIPINKGKPIIPEGAGSFYALYSTNGKRIYKPLGKDAQIAFTEFSKMEVAHEEKRTIALPSRPNSDADNLSIGRLRAIVGHHTAEIRTLAERLGTLHEEIASLSLQMKSMRDPERKKSRIERHLSLRSAARQVGVNSHTLKEWMEKELGIIFPKVRHGSKLLVLESDVRLLLERKRDARRGRSL